MSRVTFDLLTPPNHSHVLPSLLLTSPSRCAFTGSSPARRGCNTPRTGSLVRSSLAAAGSSATSAAPAGKTRGRYSIHFSTSSITATQGCVSRHDSHPVVQVTMMITVPSFGKHFEQIGASMFAYLLHSIFSLNGSGPMQMKELRLS